MGYSRTLIIGDSNTAEMRDAGGRADKMFVHLITKQVNASICAYAGGGQMIPRVPGQEWSGISMIDQMSGICAVAALSGFDLVLVMCGSNEAIMVQDHGSLTDDDIEKSYKEFLRMLKILPLGTENIVLVGAMPTQAGDTLAVQRIRQLQEVACIEQGVEFINPSAWGLLAKHFADGYHFNQAGHDVVADNLVAEIKALGYWSAYG